MDKRPQLALQASQASCKHVPGMGRKVHGGRREDRLIQRLGLQNIETSLCVPHHFEIIKLPVLHWGGTKKKIIILFRPKSWVQCTEIVSRPAAVRVFTSFIWDRVKASVPLREIFIEKP